MSKMPNHVEYFLDEKDFLSELIAKKIESFMLEMSKCLEDYNNLFREKDLSDEFLLDIPTFDDLDWQDFDPKIFEMSINYSDNSRHCRQLGGSNELE